MKKTGGDFFTLAEIRAMLREVNTHLDGPTEVAFVDDGAIAPGPALEFRGDVGDHVVTLPGDGQPFPEKAFAEALRVAPVIIERE